MAPGNLGFNVAWNKNIDIGKGWSTFLGASAGANLAVIPVLNVTAGVAKTTGNLDDSLDLKIKKTYSAGAHATMANGILGAGVSLAVDKNRDRSRIEQANQITKSLKGVLMDLLPQEKSENDKITLGNEQVLTALKKRYPGSKEETLQKAAQNLVQYMGVYNGLQNNKETRAMIVQELSDAYAQAWANAQAEELHGKKYRSRQGVDITFFAGIIPIVSV